jgi:IclR family transcriptional regulator, pca regulon regulatory protein
MEALVAHIHESCSLSVLDGGEIIYVARAPTRRIMTVAINVGTRFPAYATSMGRVLLAEPQGTRGLPRQKSGSPHHAQDDQRPPQGPCSPTRIAAQGSALVDQEFEVGLRSLAVRIHGPDRAVIAALNVCLRRAVIEGLVQPDCLMAEVVDQGPTLRSGVAIDDQPPSGRWTPSWAGSMHRLP